MSEHHDQSALEAARSSDDDRSGDVAAPDAAELDSTAGRGSGNEPILVVDHLVKHFPIKSGIIIDRQIGAVRAVDDVSFTVRRGETLGLVGESGCGKSTLARTILQLLTPTSGSVRFEEEEIVGLKGKALRRLRSRMQIVFQDPYASLNPRKRVAQIVGDPMRLHGIASSTDDAKEKVRELLERVGLNPEHYNRFPHQFSGGQRQRIGIARALSLNPQLIVADEPVSALDVSIQAQIINLLEDLQGEFDLTYIFVAHDLSVVRHVADRIAVMYLGKIVEIGPGEEVYNRPIHPYTQSLLSAVPIPDPRANAERRQIILEGDVPSPANPPSACRFHTRCPYATEVCSEQEPRLIDHGGGHFAACWHPLDAEGRPRDRDASPVTA
jgi:oligopeptide transport system ATP-binding protein